jgi:hypothetical protein
MIGILDTANEAARESRQEVEALQVALVLYIRVHGRNARSSTWGERGQRWGGAL